MKWLNTCVALLLLAGATVLAQDSDLGPREARIQVNRLLTAGDYASAIPLLQQLIKWFSESKNKNIILEMEATYFHLGLCNFFLGRFAEANKGFDDYLKKYPRGAHCVEAAVYTGDGYRFSNDLAKAVKAYEHALATYPLDADWRADVLGSLVRCALAQDDWKTAIPLLQKLYTVAPDDARASWAATLLTIAYLRERQYDKIYNLVPYLLRPNSFASRSAAFNMAALEAGDELFAEEQYRDALWIYRLVFPKATIESRCQRHLTRLQKDAEILRQSGDGQYRELMRTQEYIAEVEAELKAIQEVQDYSEELAFRVARAYMETRRVWEARAAFLDLHQALEGDKAEEALSLAFHCSVQIEPWDEAFQIGEDYLGKYPEGRWYDQISLTMGQMHALKKDWPAVIELLTRVLAAHPKHESAAECLFLLGYACFMEEKYVEAVTWLRRLNTEYPEHDRVEEATYWLAMSLLFNKGYEQALKEFGDFLAGFPDSPYREDATYRHAVCQYGLSRFGPAEQELLRFVQAYPRSILAGEAWMMLADIVANNPVAGNLQQAVRRYQKALEHELNIELYNYCSFRCGEMLSDLNDFPGLISHFQAYLKRDRPESNRPLAVYWIGKALWQMDKRAEALAYYRESLAAYGKDRMALGIDLILDEWIGRTKSAPPELADQAWKDLRELMAKAEAEQQTALLLRLQRGFLYRPGITDEAREGLLRQLVRAENLDVAPVVVLELIMDEAARRGDPDLGIKAAETIIRDFPETDTGLAARMHLARVYAERRQYDAAEAQLNVIRQVFATSPAAAEALLLLGRMYMEQKRFEDADRCFESILGVREWRGPLWPEALYGRGECARQRRQYDKAAAYYERIYLLYAHYRAWTAKAYLRRAECLVRLREPDKAREVVAEMLANPELKDSEEAKEAQTLLAEISKT